MPSFDGHAGLEAHPEGRAEERPFDVVDGERVAGEQHVHVTTPDQVAEVRRASGMHDDRADHEGDPPARLLDVAHHLGDALDARFDVPLRGDAVRS